ncbi:hypothetical protein ACHWQZ_G009861 [Mnemiopsis leidyi]
MDQNKECGFCTKSGVDLKKCTACKKIWYCNIQCQRADWQHHKENCAIVRVYPKILIPHKAVNFVTGEVITHNFEPDQYQGKTEDMIVKIQTTFARAMNSVGTEFLTRWMLVYDKSRKYQVKIVGAEGYDENYDAISDKILVDGLPCVQKHPLLKKLYFKARLYPDSSLDVYLDCTYNDQNW